MRYAFNENNWSILCDEWSIGTFGSVKYVFLPFSAQTKKNRVFGHDDPEHQFAENVVRNGPKSAFLGSQLAPFSCKNANLPNRTCFRRVLVYPPPPTDYMGTTAAASCPPQTSEVVQRLGSFRGQKLNTNFFSQTFRAPPGYPGKILGYPAQKV